MVESLIEDVAAPQTFRSCHSTWQTFTRPPIYFNP